jgi:hypothetical protein
MAQEWFVKKNPERMRVIVYSVVGMAIVMCMLTLMAFSSAK